MSHRAFRIALLASVLAFWSCGDDPAVAPLARSGSARVALSVVGGTLSAPATSSPALDCPAPEAGFPEDVIVFLTVLPPTGTPIEASEVIPARTPTGTIEVEGLVPGPGYGFAVEVRRINGALLFDGSVPDQVVRPGTRVDVAIPLVPTGRRGVLGVGAGNTTGGDAFVVPIFVSHSLALRGVQFDLCFDETRVEVLGVSAIGRVAGFDGISGGWPAPESPYRVVLWSSDGGARVPPGEDALIELQMRFLPAAQPGTPIPLVFVDAILADSSEPSENFEVYFFDGSVTR